MNCPRVETRALLPKLEGRVGRVRATHVSSASSKMEPAAVLAVSFDQLPADLIVHVAVQLCSGPGLIRMESTCSAWRAAIRGPAQDDMLWKLVTLERFPRIERVLKVKPTSKAWREIYRLQHRTAAVARPKPKAEDFVLSFELKKGEQMLAEGAAPLVSPPEDDETDLSSALLWEPDNTPKVLRDDWANQELWKDEPHPTLSIWVTRDLQTVPMYVEACCDGGSIGVAGNTSLGSYEERTPPEIKNLSSLFTSPTLDALLQADFEEANGSVTLTMWGGTSPHCDLAAWPGTLILEYLDALVPRALRTTVQAHSPELAQLRHEEE